MTVRWGSNRPIYRGYGVFSVVFLAQMLTIGLVTYGFGIFVHPVSAEFHLSRAEMNTALIIVITGMALAAPIVGVLIDRYEPKYVMSFGAMLFGASVCAVALAHSALMAALLLIPLSVSAVAVSHVMTSSLVSRWFFWSRGRALGLAAISGSMSGVIVVPALAFLVNALGWRSALFDFGLLEGSVIALLSFVLVASGPSGQDIAERGGLAEVAEGRTRGYAWRELLGRRDFWCIGVATGLLVAVDQSLFASLVAYGQERGMGLRQASFLVTITAAVAIIRKAASGYLCDKIDKRWLLWTAASFTIVFMGILASHPSDPVLYLGCATVGMAIGGTIPVWYSSLAHRFGTTSYGKALGLTVLVHLPLASSVLWLTGRIHDRTGSYQDAFFVFAGLAAFAGLSISPVTMKPPKSGRSADFQSLRTETPAIGPTAGAARGRTPA